MKKLIVFAGLVAGVFLLSNCNKEKKLMDTLLGNWKIESSTRSKMHIGGADSAFEMINNAGKLVIYEDPNNPSKESKLYDFLFIDGNSDTLQASDTLISDEKNKRIILQNALTDSTGQKWDIVWTIEKSKKNKQEWTAYGVDSTFFYPANNHNPGNATNWLAWRITLDRE